MITLRSASWEGLPPAPGDVVQLGEDEVAVVRSVAQGAGAGHWRLECEPTRLIVWWASGRISGPRPAP